MCLSEYVIVCVCVLVQVVSECVCESVCVCVSVCKRGFLCNPVRATTAIMQHNKTSCVVYTVEQTNKHYISTVADDARFSNAITQFSTQNRQA